jgi:hypothetical protein
VTLELPSDTSGLNKYFPHPTEITQRMIDLQTESDLQFDCIQALKKLGVFVSASANGIKCSPRQMRQMKNKGLVPGFPDLEVILPGPKHIYIELKTRTGKRSPEQIAVHTKMDSLGCEVHTCHTVDEVLRLVTRETR